MIREGEFNADTKTLRTIVNGEWLMVNYKLLIEEFCVLNTHSAIAHLTEYSI